jgi:hypothetical protein
MDSLQADLAGNHHHLPPEGRKAALVQKLPLERPLPAFRVKHTFFPRIMQIPMSFTATDHFLGQVSLLGELVGHDSTWSLLQQV